VTVKTAEKTSFGQRITSCGFSTKRDELMVSDEDVKCEVYRDKNGRKKK